MRGLIEPPLSATRPLPVLLRGLDQGGLSSWTGMDPMSVIAHVLETKRTEEARLRGLGGAMIAAIVMAPSLGGEDPTTDGDTIVADDDTASPSTT